VRPSHVGAGIVVGLVAGAAYGALLAKRDHDACARDVHCDGPDLQPIVDPLFYGAIGGAVGGLTMLWWRWR
jgi:hypothetical protein